MNSTIQYKCEINVIYQEIFRTHIQQSETKQNPIQSDTDVNQDRIC